MVGLSKEPQGPDKPVDHGKTMRKAFDKFKTRSEWPVDEEEFKKLGDDERQIANDWRNMSPMTRNELVDGLINIDDKLKKGEPVNSDQLKTFRTVEGILPKVFGENNTIDSIMNRRRSERRGEGEWKAKVRLEGEKDREVLKSLDDDLRGLPPEAEVPAGTLDGVSQDELTRQPNPQSPTEETFR